MAGPGHVVLLAGDRVQVGEVGDRVEHVLDDAAQCRGGVAGVGCGDILPPHEAMFLLCGAMDGWVGDVDAFEGEDVDPEAQGAGGLVEEGLDGASAGVNELAVGVDRRAVAVADEGVVLPECPLLPQVVELFVVVAGHVDVDIIIPGDEATVSQRPDERAVCKRIGELMLAADAVQLAQNV